MKNYRTFIEVLKSVDIFYYLLHIIRIWFVMPLLSHSWKGEGELHSDNNNPFNDPLSKTLQVRLYQKNIHSLTHCLCGYYTTSLI